jgi:hypothetical protein
LQGSFIVKTCFRVLSWGLWIESVCVAWIPCEIDAEFLWWIVFFFLFFWTQSLGWFPHKSGDETVVLTRIWRRPGVSIINPTVAKRFFHNRLRRRRFLHEFNGGDGDFLVAAWSLMIVSTCYCSNDFDFSFFPFTPIQFGLILTVKSRSYVSGC